MKAQPTPVASGPSDGVTPFGNCAADGAEIFEHAAPRPIRIGAVLEDHIHKREAVEGIAAHDFRVRHREHFRREGIGHLVLDDLRRLPLPFGVDDDLRIRQVGDGIKRNIAQGEDAGEHEGQSGQQNDEFVPQRKIDDAFEHLLNRWCSCVVVSGRARWQLHDRNERHPTARTLA